jgi:putative ABC transport system substrate-binding protein
MPVEQQTKFQLIVNLKTAKALGLTASKNFFTCADELTE